MYQGEKFLHKNLEYLNDWNLKSYGRKGNSAVFSLLDKIAVLSQKWKLQTLQN
jgi:hypothetical protein